MDCGMHFLRLVITLVKDEKFVRHLQCGDCQLLFFVVTLILT